MKPALGMPDQCPRAVLAESKRRYDSSFFAADSSLRYWRNDHDFVHLNSFAEERIRFVEEEDRITFFAASNTRLGSFLFRQCTCRRWSADRCETDPCLAHQRRFRQQRGRCFRFAQYSNTAHLLGVAVCKRSPGPSARLCAMSARSVNCRFDPVLRIDEDLPVSVPDAVPLQPSPVGLGLERGCVPFFH